MSSTRHPAGGPIVCVRIPEFPAWAHARERNTRGVIVVRGGKVVSASRSARRKGVVDGMGAATAQGRDPESRLVQRDAPLENVAWEGALEVLHEHTPFLEPVAPGLAFLAAIAPHDLEGDARRLGLAVGWGRVREVARIAAARAAEGGMVGVALGREAQFWQRTPTAVLVELEFAPWIADRLIELGLTTLASIRTLTLRHLEAQFAEEGARLYALLHARPGPPLAPYSPPPVIRARTYFDDALSEPAHLLPAVDVLVSEAVSHLGTTHCRRVQVRTETDGAWTTTTRILPISSCEAGYLGRTARRLLLDALESFASSPEVTGLAVELAGLGSVSVQQGALFRTRPTLHLAARGVHRRFPGAMVRMVVVDHAVFDEDRIRVEPFPEKAPPSRRRAA